MEDKLKISLAAARVNADMTQQDVADRLHVSKKTVVNWEKGRTLPSFTTINELSRIYRMPVCYIFLPKEST
ncbi:helix-turn-helix transcriptional regulator [Bacillota bacterium HCP3S3_E9]